MPAQFARAGRALALIAAAVLMLAAAPASLAQQPAPPPPSPLAELEPMKLALDQVEATLKREDLPLRTLFELGRTVASARDQIRAKTAELEPRFAEISVRLSQLGPAPPAGAPPEDATIAAERTRINQVYGDLDAALKQARLLAVRADSLNDRIVARRRSLVASELFQPTPSVLDVFFWAEAAQAFGGDVRSIGVVLQSWGSYAADNGGAPRIAAAVLTLVVLGIAWAALVRWLRRRFPPALAYETRFAKVRACIWVFAWGALAAPALLLAAISCIELFGLVPQRIDDLATGLVIAVVVASFGRGVARAVLAPGEPQRRLIALDETLASAIYDHFVWGARALGVSVFLHVAHRAIAAPPILTVATSALLALVVMALLLRLLWVTRAAAAAENVRDVPRLLWVRAVAWVVVAAILVALIAGYAGAAYFVAERLMSTLAMLGALYLLLVAIDSLFTEALSPATPVGRSLALNLGLPLQKVSLIGAFLSGVIRLLLTFATLLLLAGPWEVGAVDFLELLKGLAGGFRIGEITISLGAAFGAVFVVVLGLLATRILRRWLDTQLLPHTAMDPGLQNSVATIIVYLGIIAAIAFGLAQLGIDLQKIALIAGALSVGIGFGLQSIVSNFVSGLILLAERPIRVGDQINVKGEEGKVRRISVRATEIETADQGSVIIPNSELITGMVKNWTHQNTWGRVVIRVGVGYESDAEAVRDILLTCATEHPQVVAGPAPSVQLASLGDNALQFEVYAVITNVSNAGSIRSDIHFAILKRFREAGIKVAYPQREVRLLGDKPSASPK